MNQSILIVAATEGEVKPLIEFFGARKLTESGNYIFKEKTTFFRIFITGVGVPKTVYNLLMELIHVRPQLVINAGVAGAFNRDLKLGQTVFVTEDCFADLGAEDKESFLSVYDLGIDNPASHPFSKGKLKPKKYPELNAINSLFKAKAITVNTAHGNARSIAMFQSYFKPDIESMEGAGVFFTCLRRKVPVMQIRSISNYVEVRNKANWKIPEAISGLNKTLIKIVKEIATANKKSQPKYFDLD